MERKVTLEVNGVKLNLVLGKTWTEWDTKYGSNLDVWDVLFEELIDGTLEINPDIWYWYIDGRCYETTETVK